MKVRFGSESSILAVLFVCSLCGPEAFGQPAPLFLDFNSNPQIDFPDIQFIGTSTWRGRGGVDGSGYLSVTDAQNGQRGAIIFPDLSDPPGTALEQFKITADLRVGGGTASPADGFSFNLVRPDDPLLQDTVGDGYAAGPNNEANLPEEGSQTGLGIGFDEWQSGGADPNATAEDCGSVDFDCIGISVRVDNELILQAPFPTLNGTVDDTTSLQTGPAASPANTLGWAPFSIEVTPDPSNSANSIVLITYKGREVINESIEYRTTPGQLVFGGRTGGSNANHHIDNIFLDLGFSPTPGDFNNDGAVDAADFDMILTNFRTSGRTFGEGDMDFNGRIDLHDFLAFAEAFENANAAAVPEPGTWIMAILGLSAFLTLRRIRH